MVAIEDPLPLVHRCPGPPPDGAPQLQLALSADERTRLRGLRRSRCGRPLLLQLERGEPLRPGEWLRAEGAGAAWVRVEAAAEPLLIVRATSTLALLQAAYHLGNRHVALEIRADELRLLQDPVLAALLEQRGLTLVALEAPFHPERGAYGAHSHDHSHSHDPSHDQSHGH